MTKGATGPSHMKLSAACMHDEALRLLVRYVLTVLKHPQSNPIYDHRNLSFAHLQLNQHTLTQLSQRSHCSCLQLRIAR